MAFMRSFVVVAALVLAIGQEVESYKKLSQICQELHTRLSSYPELRSDGRKAFEYAKEALTLGSTPFSRERKLVKAWEAIINDEKCSSSSWDHLLMMSLCRPDQSITILEQPTRAYAKKCLTSELVSEKIKKANGGMFATKVNFVDAAFIEKYQELNSNEGPLDLEYNGQSCCKAEGSFEVIKASIERDLSKRGKSLEKEFKAFNGLESYLKKKLFKPCESYVDTFDALVGELKTVSTFYEGGNQALIGALSSDEHQAIFRFKYCNAIQYNQEEILEAVSKLLA